MTAHALQFGGPREEEAARALLPTPVRPKEEDTDDDDGEDENMDAAPAQEDSPLSEGKVEDAHAMEIDSVEDEDLVRVEAMLECIEGGKEE